MPSPIHRGSEPRRITLAALTRPFCEMNFQLLVRETTLEIAWYVERTTVDGIRLSLELNAQPSTRDHEKYVNSVYENRSIGDIAVPMLAGN